MNLIFRLNGENMNVEAREDERLRDLLYRLGCASVRDSDDAEGFTGSDTVIVDGKCVYSNLIAASRVMNKEVFTAESLSPDGKMNDVQEAMIASGVVQSAYNSPAVALVLTNLLERKPDASKDDVKEALSGLFIRDAGYEHFFLAVRLVQEKRKWGEYKSKVSPSFRDEMRFVGKAKKKIDAAALVKGEKVFTEDKVLPSSYVLKILRSPYAHAYIKSIDTEEAEKLDGVAKILTCFNVPDVYYMQAGQGNPEPSPYDRKLINRKVRHVGDRVAAVVARNEEIAAHALSLIKVTITERLSMFQVPRIILKSTTGDMMRGMERLFISSPFMRISATILQQELMGESGMWRRHLMKAMPLLIRHTRQARCSAHRLNLMYAFPEWRTDALSSMHPLRFHTM